VSAPARLALRVYHRLSRGGKASSELRFWLEEWEPALRRGGLWGPDTLELSGDREVATTYDGRRWQQARAEVRRVLDEAGIADHDYFAGKVVVDIGPGPVGFPDACPADVSIGVDPLAEAYAERGLLLDSRAVYLAVQAEAMPLRSSSVDVVVCRNSLDHVRDPRAVLLQVSRVLRPGGCLILNVDVDHEPSRSEPHELRLARLRDWLRPLVIEHEHEWDHGHVPGGGRGHAVVIRARKPAGPGRAGSATPAARSSAAGR
jgi:SAM-dependent methyltransferase